MNISPVTATSASFRRTSSTVYSMTWCARLIRNGQLCVEFSVRAAASERSSKHVGRALRPAQITGAKARDGGENAASPCAWAADNAELSELYRSLHPAGRAASD